MFGRTVTLLCIVLFFFNDQATTEIYTSCHSLSLPDALPLSYRTNNDLWAGCRRRRRLRRIPRRGMLQLPSARGRQRRDPAFAVPVLRLSRHRPQGLSRRQADQRYAEKPRPFARTRGDHSTGRQFPWYATRTVPPTAA